MVGAQERALDPCTSWHHVRVGQLLSVRSTAVPFLPSLVPILRRTHLRPFFNLHTLSLPSHPTTPRPSIQDTPLDPERPSIQPSRPAHRVRHTTTATLLPLCPFPDPTLVPSCPPALALAQDRRLADHPIAASHSNLLTPFVSQPRRWRTAHAREPQSASSDLPLLLPCAVLVHRYLSVAPSLARASTRHGIVLWQQNTE